MTGAALYLLGCTLRNRLRLLARQLRNPRYLVAVLLGVGYLVLVLLGQRHGAGPGAPPAYFSLLGLAVLLILVGKWWLLGADATALAFSRPEIQFLFPAPVSRRALIGYKLARTQLLILFNVLLWTVLFRRAGTGTGVLAHAVGLWLAFTIITLHRLGVALSRESLLQHGRSGWRRSWPPVVVLLAYVAAVLLAVQRVTPLEPGPLPWVAALLVTAPLRQLLVPFALAVAPLGAETLEAFLRSLPPALLLLGLHLVWVLRADRRFEEAAIAASLRRAELLARWRRDGSIRPPMQRRRGFRLGAAGSAVTAIVWKNLTRLLRTLNPYLIPGLGLVLVAAVVGGVLVPGAEEVTRMAGVISLSWAAVLTLLGPQWVRVDLRGDLEHRQQLRTWPLSGFRLMAGMVAGSTLVVWGGVTALGLVGLLALGLLGDLGASPMLVVTLALTGMLLLGGITTIAVTIQNGAALLFPAWVGTELRPGGVEQVGQHLLTAGVSLLLLAVFLLGPGLLGGGVGYLLADTVGAWALVPAGLLATTGLALEAFLLLDWLGDRFDESDALTE